MKWIAVWELLRAVFWLRSHKIAFVVLFFAGWLPCHSDPSSWLCFQLRSFVLHELCKILVRIYGSCHHCKRCSLRGKAAVPTKHCIDWQSRHDKEQMQKQQDECRGFWNVVSFFLHAILTHGSLEWITFAVGFGLWWCWEKHMLQCVKPHLFASCFFVMGWHVRRILPWALLRFTVSLGFAWGLWLNGFHFLETSHPLSCVEGWGDQGETWSWWG